MAAPLTVLPGGAGRGFCAEPDVAYALSPILLWSLRMMRERRGKGARECGESKQHLAGVTVVVVSDS